jgi:putrescine transport system ATP-binding protein
MAKKPQLAFETRPWRDPAAKPFVRIKNVTKKFGDVTAVHDVSLDIYKSELFCLLGGSGSGKSTLLRMLAGFEQPTSGTIEIDGQDMTQVAPYNRPVNMMFQSYALFPHMNVEQNIAYGLKRDHMPKGEIADRVAELLSLVKLQDYGKRKPHQLSGGQRQRVALARALAKRPKLLLLDEPLGALDKKLREETQFELVKIQESLGVTFIVVTHDQEEAMTLATRIGVMNQGEIAMIGEPTDIYEFPNSKFVANFIGSANMVEGGRTGLRHLCRPRRRLRPRPDPVVGHSPRKDACEPRQARGPVRRQCHQGHGRGYRLSGRYEPLPGGARQRQTRPREPDQHGARQP